MTLESLALLIITGIVVGWFAKVFVVLCYPGEVFGFVRVWWRKVWFPGVEDETKIDHTKNWLCLATYKWHTCPKCVAGIMSLLIFPLVSGWAIPIGGFIEGYTILNHFIFVTSALSTGLYLEAKL